MVVKLVRDAPADVGQSPPRVLLVAEHVIIAALLGALVELAGYSPCFPKANERPAAAIDRLAPAIVLLDAGHDAALDDEVYHFAGASGATLCLFGHRHDLLRVSLLASRRGVRSFAVPVDYRTFEHVLGEAAGRA